MATNAPMPGPTFVTIHARFFGSTITSCSHYRVQAADQAEATAISAQHCPPGWIVTKTFPATHADRQPWLN
jgi:hypothetical protein